MLFDDLSLNGEVIALIDEYRREISYSELTKRADIFSSQIGPSCKLVLIEAQNNLASVVAIVGCFRGRHPFVLCSDKSRDGIQSSFRPDVAVDSTGHVHFLANHGADRLHPNLSILLSTSGSTGATKLVRLSETAMDSNAAAIADYLKIDPSARAITTLPLSYSYGLSVLTSHLSVGASIVLTDKSVIDDEFWELFETTKASSLAGVPYTYELLEAIGFRDRSFPHLRSMTQAGGRLPPDMVERYARWGINRGVRFYTMYGQTEAAPRMAYLPPELALRHPDCIGRAIPGGQLRVVDAVGRDVAENTTGELVYKGANVMMGYATGSQDLARGPELAELYTGDLAREVEKGLFKIVGRSSRISKIAGLRIGLDDVERLLQDHHHDAVVAGNDELVAVAVHGDAAMVSAVNSLLERHTTIPFRSRCVFSVFEIPRLPSGKTDYQSVLRAGLVEYNAEVTSRLASTIHEKSFALEFARAFNQRIFDRRASFSSLCGDSLAYVELSIALEHALGRLPEGWERLSIEQIDVLISKHHASVTALVPRMSTEIVLRAVAIAFVVAHHTLQVDLGGGLDVLLLLFGLNLARSQGRRFVSAGRWTTVRDVVLTLVVPYYAILLCYVFKHTDKVPWEYWALIGNFYQTQYTLAIYWFVSGYVQTLLIFIVMASIPPVRRVMNERPGLFGALFLMAALLLKVGTLAIFHHSALGAKTPDQFIYLVALGWCLHETKTPAWRMALTMVVVCISVLEVSGVASTWWLAFDGQWRGESLLGGFVVLAYVRSLRVPFIMRKVFTNVAMASLVIYLTHPPLISLTWNLLPFPRDHNPLCLVLIACILAVGVAAYRAIGYLRHHGLKIDYRFRSPLSAGVQSR